MTARKPGPLGRWDDDSDVLSRWLSGFVGPLGRWVNDFDIDPRPLAPGPTGLRIMRPIPMQLRVASKKLGLTVHPDSKISGEAWKKKINENQNVAEAFKKQIVWIDNRLALKGRFRYPRNATPPRWLDSWRAGMSSAEWEITTGHVEISLEQSGDVDMLLVPHISKGESTGIRDLSDHFVWKSTRDEFKLHLGETIEKDMHGARAGAQLRSRRGLIIIAIEIQVTFQGIHGKHTELLQLTDDDQVNVWFHEISLHAGRKNLKLPYAHEDDPGGEVNFMTTLINEDFPGSSPGKRVVTALGRLRAGDDLGGRVREMIDSLFERNLPKKKHKTDKR